MSRFFRCFVGVVAWFGMANVIAMREAQAETFRMALPSGTEVYFDYQVGALRLALEHAPGDHRLEVASIDLLTQGRLMDMLRQDKINVTLAGYNRAWEQEFLQVDFPLTRGLQGYRILVIPPALQPDMSNIQNVEDLKSYCIGSGANWQDTRILKQAGLCVEEAPQNVLFQMLEIGRFDMLHRAVHEALVGENTARMLDRGLVLERDLILRYKYDFFFYVRRQDKKLHDILEQGFQAAFYSGAFTEYFQSNPAIAAAMTHIRTSNRRIIDIDNVDLSGQTQENVQSFWLSN